MKVAVAHPSELGASELDRWRSLQLADPALGNPFLSPEFALAVGSSRADARVGVLEEGGELVGFFPFERKRGRIGKPIGSRLSDCQGLVHAPGLDWDPRQLLRGCGLDVWEFDHLLVAQAPFRPYHSIAERSPVMDLSRGYDAYIAERARTSKSLLATTKRKARKLAREVGPLRFAAESTDRAALATLMAWKSAQYRRTGMWDRFSRGWIVQLVEELFSTRTATFSGTLAVVYAGDEPVAAHFGIRSGSILAWWLPSYDVRFSAYSPGITLLLHMAEAAAAGGLGQIDLGKGHKDYKERLKSWDVPIAEGWVERPSLTAAVRKVQRLPHRFVLGYVVNGPLEHSARATLRQLGRVRSALPGGGTASKST